MATDMIDTINVARGEWSCVRAGSLRRVVRLVVACYTYHLDMQTCKYCEPAGWGGGKLRFKRLRLRARCSQLILGVWKSLTV